MNCNFVQGTVYAALVLAVAACTGAGGLAGIGGSGFVATGTITGFGSVFVNGIEFETTESTEIEIEGEISNNQDDLGIGMVVRVSGSVNEDGVTGTATTIVFDDDLQGPVSGLDPVSGPDADGNRSFSVLGIPVIAGSETTFAVSDVVSPPPASFDINTIANGDTVEISGFFNGSGELLATRVELEDGSSEVEVKGTITGLDLLLEQFALNVNSTTSIVVDFTSMSMLEDLPNGLQNDIYVEVKGSYDAGTNTLTASYIEGEEGGEGIEDSEQFSVEGLVSDYNGIDDFRVNGILVNATGAEFEPSSLQTMLADGMRIEAEGAIVNSVLIADEIEARSGSVRVQAPVSAIDMATGNFEVKPYTSEDIIISITVTTSTESGEPFSVGDFVEVRGYVNESGGITATRVELEDPDDDVVLRGTFEAGTVSGGSIRVLGIDVAFNGSTSFEDENETSIDAATFFSSVVIDSSIIEVKDEATADGFADEVEIK